MNILEEDKKYYFTVWLIAVLVLIGLAVISGAIPFSPELWQKK